MRNVRDRQDRLLRLCAATKFGVEFGALNTAAGKADVQVTAFFLFRAEHSKRKRGTGKLPAVKPAGIVFSRGRPIAACLAARRQVAGGD
jgi:hypothetical protein